MAYELKYQADFYNRLGTAVSMKIYKKDYADSEVIALRVSNLTLTVNYNGDKIPVIGTGVKAIIETEASDMQYLEDLLISYEREFMCTVEYGGIVAFRGFLINDLNERQLLTYSRITLQFTDYLHRLSEEYPACLNRIGESVDLFTLVDSITEAASLDIPLYVNSTLFEDSMSNGATDTFLPQVYAQNVQFYSNSFAYDNMYDALNKALTPFNAFLYYHKDKWILERQEDITRVGNWVKYDTASATPTSEASLKQEYNRQNGDFIYLERTQLIEYDTGLKKLTLNLQDKKLDSLVFNDYTGLYNEEKGTGNIIVEDFVPTVVGLRTDYYPRGGQLPYRTWYINSNATDVKVGSEYLDLNLWIHWDVVEASYYSASYGVYYDFAIQFNQDREGDSSGGALEKETNMSVGYKMATDQNFEAYGIWKVTFGFLLRVNGGTFNNYWIKRAQWYCPGYDQEDYFDDTIVLFPPIDSPLADSYSTFPEIYLQNQTTIDVREDHQMSWGISKDFPLSTLRCWDAGTNTMYDNFWQAVGYDEIQHIMIMFLPPHITNTEKEPLFAHLLETIYLGDITVSMTTEEIDNRIEYHLNENFYKKDEVNLALFDLPNINYSNGLMFQDLSFTKSWSSENSQTSCPLYEIFAKCKFRKYGRTIHRLRATIQHDGILKPFSILTDNNVGSETSSGVNMTLLLNGYSWDIPNGTYDIEAEEYTEEEIIVDGVTYDSEGIPDETIPDAPTGLSVSLRATYGHPVEVIWNPVGGGITGYELQRDYSWNGISWVSGWVTIDTLTETRYIDRVAFEREGEPTAQTLTYRVRAFNSVGPSDWSNTDSVYWSM